MKKLELQIQLSPRIAVHVGPLNEISIVLEGWKHPHESYAKPITYTNNKRSFSI